MEEINSQGGFGTQGSDAASVGGAVPLPGVSQSSGSTESIYDSTIQHSDLDAMALMMIAGIPMLTPPSEQVDNSQSSSPVGSVGGASGAQSDFRVEQMKHDIIMKMWDSFIVTLREIADRARSDDIRRQTIDADKSGAMSSTQYFAYLMSITPLQRAEELGPQGDSSVTVQFSTTFNNWLVTPAGGTSGISGDYPSAAFVAGAVIGSADAIRSAIGFDSGVLGVQLSASPVADALHAVGPATGLPGDYQAAAAMVAALLYNGALYKAVETNIDAAASGGKPIQDLNFAIDFAKNIRAIITQNIEGDEAANPQRASQNNMVRLMLASIALNMLYRAGYGGMQGLDFAAILAGNTKDIPVAIRGLVESLASLINSYLPKTGNERNALIVSLMEDVDSKESVDSMLETSSFFSALLTGDGLASERLSSGGV